MSGTELSSIIKSLLSKPNAVAESRLWLLTDLRELLTDADLRQKQLLTLSLRSPNQRLLTDLLKSWVRVSPATVIETLANDQRMWVHFFRRESRRIRKWFEHFHYDTRPTHGAAALSKYAFDHRDQVWDLLRWNSKRAVTPVVAAARLREMMLLDVVRSVDAICVDHREFFSSEPWLSCVKNGEIVAVDEGFFVKELLGLIRAERTECLSAFARYLGSPACLSPAILSSLNDKDLYELVCKGVSGTTSTPSTAIESSDQAMIWLKQLCLSVHTSTSFQELLVNNALLLHCQDIARMYLSEPPLQQWLTSNAEMLHAMFTAPLSLPDSVTRSQALEHVLMHTLMATLVLRSSEDVVTLLRRLVIAMNIAATETKADDTGRGDWDPIHAMRRKRSLSDSPEPHHKRVHSEAAATSSSDSESDASSDGSDSDSSPSADEFDILPLEEAPSLVMWDVQGKGHLSQSEMMLFIVDIVRTNACAVVCARLRGE